ncbi:ankyrin repeat protein [Catovirus CTV1]|uniref:Ankyrin repeat protein n=1 Tax=Catovirus CTV1 TaxID=1977631 RepID=A0A1V0S8T0_9VIRU|nr:ankyrin repeat protein [Catovirus CTV1]
MSLRDLIINGDLEGVKKFVSENNINKNYAIQLASSFGHLDIVKYFISIEADISSEKYYPVRTASSNGHLNILKHFVSLGADIRICDDYAVRWSAERGHLEVVKYLVSLGANIKAFDDYAIYWSSSNEQFDVVIYLIKVGAGIKRICKRNVNKLFYYCLSKSEFDVLAMLLDYWKIDDENFGKRIIKIKNNRNNFFINLKKMNNVTIITKN